MRTIYGLLICVGILLLAIYLRLPNNCEGFTEKSYDVVISRYKEQLDWLSLLEGKPIRYVYIYNKGPDAVILPKLPGQVKIVQLPNVGVCDHTYLYHIVNEYDNLADVTVFLPASAHGVDRKRATVQAVLRKTFDERKTCMAGYAGQGTVYEQSKDFKLDEWKVTDPKNQENIDYELVKANPRPFGEWYKKYIPQKDTNRLSLTGMFSVSKNSVRAHDLEMYIRLMDQLNKDKFPEAAHYMERSWATVLDVDEMV